MTTPPDALDDNLQDLYDDAPCGFVSTAADGSVLRVNATFARWLGSSASSLDDLRFPDLLTAGSRLLWLTHQLPRLEATGRLDTVALDLAVPGAEAVPVLVSAVQVPRPDARPITRLTVMDARERRSFETQLVAAREAAERAEWRVRALHGVTDAAAATTSPGELLDAVAKATTIGLSASGTAIWLPPADGTGLSLAAAHDLPAAAASPRLQVTAGDPLGDAWLSGHVVQAGAVVAIPVLFGGERHGLIGVHLAEGSVLAPADLDAAAMIGTLVGQALARTRMHEHLRHLAHHDALTGLANRAALTEGLQRTVRRPGSEDGASVAPSVGVMFLDLDGFKEVNDTYGHDVGDQVLVVCASRISGVVREDDLVARLGGDEFVVLSVDLDAPTAEVVARRIEQVIREPIELDGVTLRVGASIGFAIGPTPGTVEEAMGLLARGDAEMYRVKRLRKSA